MEEQNIKCKKCGDDYFHVTKVFNTIFEKANYPANSCGYKQGAIIVEVMCEGCGHRQNIVIGEHKGQVFLSVRESEVKE